ncbi:Helix-turn-helix [Sporobacter termitidis DSM 10068]|uniref:Helix-turn-helix n=1 Tax=Sporobacter termitidis DSM 10068 TaxID=1123282 RepID=A0A1M5Z117_9FIRM|nr:helix-turn-helix transcriptional regulator [Sporobacter termitidis]SHI17997.1 Helix-turn-helix [Sporobacter termitidis DSM 10068]
MSFVSQNIEKLRLRRKLTREELAGRLSVTSEEVSSWENDEAQPDIDTLVSLAGVLNTDIAALTGEPPARKKDVRRLLIACGLLLVLGLALYFLTPFAARMKSNYYMMTPTLLIGAYLLPLFWLVLGWALMQALGVAGVAKRGRALLSRPLHIAVLIVVLLYAALMLPFFIETVYILSEELRAMKDPSLYPGGLSYSYQTPLFLQRIEMWLLNAVSRQPMIFILPGIIFWLSKPPKRQK